MYVCVCINKSINIYIYIYIYIYTHINITNTLFHYISYHMSYHVSYHIILEYSIGSSPYFGEGWRVPLSAPEGANSSYGHSTIISFRYNFRISD